MIVEKMVEAFDTPWNVYEGRRRLARWDALVPKDVALRQAAWERMVMATRMRDLGLTFREMGVHLYVDQARAQTIWRKASELRAKSIEIHGRWISPVEKWLTDNSDARRLAA